MSDDLKEVIMAGVEKAISTLDSINKDKQETETFDNTDDLLESWEACSDDLLDSWEAHCAKFKSREDVEKVHLRRLAEDAYNDWLDSPVGYRHHGMSRKDCVDFWVAAFLAGNRSAPKESNTEMLANAEIEHKNKCTKAMKQDFIKLVSEFDILRCEFYKLASASAFACAAVFSTDAILLDGIMHKLDQQIQQSKAAVKSLHTQQL